MEQCGASTAVVVAATDANADASGVGNNAEWWRGSTSCVLRMAWCTALVSRKSFRRATGSDAFLHTRRGASRLSKTVPHVPRPMTRNGEKEEEVVCVWLFVRWDGGEREEETVMGMGMEGGVGDGVFLGTASSSSEWFGEVLLLERSRGDGGGGKKGSVV